MKLTKLDWEIISLIGLIITASVYVILNAPKYFQIKGDELFAAVMTYKTLVKNGFGAKAEITGITDEYEAKTISGLILDTTPTRMYVWDGNQSWVVFQKEEFVKLAEEPTTPYLRPSAITLYPTQEYNLTVLETCEPGDDVFVRKLIYLKLNTTTSKILCNYLSRKIWNGYGGEVECNWDGKYVELNLRFIHGWEDGFVERTLSDFGYEIEKSWVLDQECLVLSR